MSALHPTTGPVRARLTHRRVEFKAASAFVSEHHRHHTPPVGHIFSLAAYEGERLCGVAIVGRPVSRHRDDGRPVKLVEEERAGRRSWALVCERGPGEEAEVAIRGLSSAVLEKIVHTIKTEPARG